MILLGIAELEEYLKQQAELLANFQEKVYFSYR